MNQIYLDQELKASSMEKKCFNIDSFSSIDRSGLKFNKIERRLLMREFSTGEKLYIQFPGKETAREKAPRPWDFRPKLQLSNGEWLKDLSFKDIWDDLYSFRDINADMSYIATLFFRIAYMMDATKTTKTLPYEDIDRDGNIISRGNMEFTWCEYLPDQEIIDGAHISPEALRGASLFPYLAYNDYLAQNEDCKYYYRATYEKNEKWDGKIGRTNTLLTHMSIIAFIEDKLRFTEITDMFQRGQGVAPIRLNMIEDITDGRVVKC